MFLSINYYFYVKISIGDFIIQFSYKLSLALLLFALENEEKHILHLNEKPIKQTKKYK